MKGFILACVVAVIFLVLSGSSKTTIDKVEDNTSVEEVKKSKDVQYVQDEIVFSLFSNSVWSKEDVNTNIKSASSIVNSHEEELSNYRRSVIVTGKSLTENPANYIGIPIKVEGEVITADRCIYPYIEPCVSGSIKSDGGPIFFVVKGNEVPKGKISIQGTAVGVNNNTPIVIGVIGG